MITILEPQPQPAVDASCQPSSDTMKVKWTKPEGPVTGYKVALSPQDHDEDVEIRILDADKTSVEFGSLRAGTMYIAKILTLDSQTESDVVQIEGETTDVQSEWFERRCCELSDQA